MCFVYSLNPSVGASLLAKGVSISVYSLENRDVLVVFASRLAPTTYCCIKKGTAREGRTFFCSTQNQARALEASQNSVADSAMVAGKVSTHAIRMVLIVPPCRPLLLATMVPATPDDRMCVVDTGRRRCWPYRLQRPW